MSDKWLHKSRRLFGIIGTFMGLSLFPIIFFIYHFKDLEISDNISDWAQFGDYIGGTLNPIISYVSLLFVGFITYLVARQSDDHNLQLNLKLKKIEAFDKITSQIEEFDLYFQGLLNYGNLMKTYASKTKDHQDISNLLSREVAFFDEKLKSVTSSRVFFENVNIKYNHLFDYNFSSKEFIHLVNLIREIQEQAVSITAEIKSIGIDLLEDIDTLEEINEAAKTAIKKYGVMERAYANEMNKLRTELN